MASTSPLSSSAVDRENPWPGLATFTEEQSALFFGRDEEIRDLTRRAEGSALTVLFGQSGLGKSSLLQAGVFPRLRTRGYWPVYVRLDHGPGAPSPAEQIKLLVLADTARAGTWTKPGAAKPGESLWEFFHHRDDRLVTTAGRVVVPVLVFDQFEELFTLGAGSGPERERAVVFMSELAELVENRPSEKLVARLEESSAEMDAFDFGRTDYRVVITLREDYLPHLETLKTIMPALMDNRMRLARMNGVKALDAVLKPGGTLVTEEVARAIVEFVAGAKGGSTERLAELDVEPPLLSVICRELNERRRTLGQAQITADLVSGNRREILTDFYERSVTDLPAEMRTFVEDRLLTKSGFRDNLALETALEFPGVTRPLIDTLVTRRLLRLEDRLGVQRVELTHDVLAEVIRASRDDRNQRLELAVSARRAWRQRWAIGGLSAAVFTLCIGAVFGIRAQRRAEQAQRDESARSSRTDLFYGSQLLEQGKVSEGIAYFARAVRSDPQNYAAGPRLISALAYRAFALPVGPSHAHGNEVVVRAVSTDGRRIVTMTDDRKIHFWDVATGRRVAEPFQLAAEASAFAMNAAGTQFAVATVDRTIRIWEVATGKLVAGPLQSGKSVIPLSFSPDGRWLAAGNSEGVAKLWNVQTGALQATLAMPNGFWVHSVEFSSDGSRVVTTDLNRSWCVWAVPSGEPLIPVVREATSQVNSGNFSPDGKLVLIADNSSAQLWEWAAGKRVGARIQGIRQGAFVRFSPDGKSLIATTRTDGMVRIWDVPSGAVRRKFDFASVSALSRDGRRLLGAWPDGTVHLADAETGKALLEPLRGSFFTSAEFSHDEREIWTSSRDGMVRRWRVDAAAAAPLRLNASNSVGPFFLLEPQTLILGSGGLQWESRDLVTGQTLAPPLVFPESLTTNTASEDRKFAAVVTQKSAVELWDLRHAPEIGRHSLAPMISGLPRFEFSKNGNRLAQFEVSSVVESPVFVWDTDSGRMIGEPFHVPGNKPTYVALDAKGERLAIGDIDGNVVVFDVATGKQLGETAHCGGQINGLAFSPDGTRLASPGAGRLVYLLDVATGRDAVPPVKLHGDANVLRFSRDGRVLTIPTRSNNEVSFWDTQTGALRVLQLSNDKPVSAFDFDRDAQRMAVRDAQDGRLQIWSMATGQLVAEPIWPLGSATATRFSPDGRFVLTRGLTSKTMEIWPVPPLVTVAPVPAWIERLATAVAGGKIGASGEFVTGAVTAEVFAALKTELAEMPDDAPYVKWGRWFLADPVTRTISPESPLTPNEAEKFFDEDKLSALIALDLRLRQLDNRSEAEIVERQIVELAGASKNPESQTGASVQLQIVVSRLIQEGKFSEAEPLARACLLLREKAYPAGNWVIPNSRGSLGEALAGQRRYTDAEPELLAAYEGLKKATGAPAARISEITRLLVQIYEATNQPEKAAEWAAKMAAAPVRPPPAPTKP